MTALEAGIVARDLEVLERFYTEVFGFSPVARLQFDELGTVVRLARGAAGLKLYAPAGIALDPPRHDDPWYRAGGFRYAALVLDTPDEVDALETACGAAGGRVLLGAHEHRPGARMALVTDPEDNPWELIWAPPPDQRAD